jgi:hypothetical protein
MHTTKPKRACENAITAFQHTSTDALTPKLVCSVVRHCDNNQGVVCRSLNFPTERNRLEIMLCYQLVLLLYRQNARKSWPVIYTRVSFSQLFNIRKVSTVEVR